MKILFITPPNFRFREVSSNGFAKGPAFLAAVLKANHDVKYLDGESMAKDERERFDKVYSNYDSLVNSHGLYLRGLEDTTHYIWKEIESVLHSFKPDIVGISTMTSSYPSALRIAEMVKKQTPATVVMGGVHPTILYEEVASSPFVDYVSRGEGEITFPKLVEHIENGTEPLDVAGVSYYKDGRLISTPDGPMIDDLDTIPFPDTEALLFPERYSATDFSDILAGRGCPARCHFCCNHVLWKKKYRLRSADNIFQELKHIYTNHSKTILFTDDNLMASPKLLFELKERMQQELPLLNWRCQSRVDTLTPEKLAVCKETGCWDIKLGVESGSDRILDYLNKRITVSEILKTCNMIVESGIQFSANFMFGFPEETWEDMQKTLDLIKKIPANSLAVSKFIPLPGTKLYDDVVKDGAFREQPTKYEHLDLFSRYYHYPKYVSRERLDEFYYEIHRIVDEKNKITRKGPPKSK